MTADTTTTLTAREYLRVSADKSGRERSIEEQHADHQLDALASGWALGEPYREGVGSASRFAVKARDTFARLIADLEADTFGADILVLWESSRGSRRVSEWAKLIDLCEDRGVRIHISSHGRTYDPGNYRDRASLHEDATDSERESGKISARTARAMSHNAAEGRPHGHVPWGYRRVYDERTGKLLRQEPDPDTKHRVVELFDRVRAGHSIRSIARDWEREGVVNRSGRPFTAAHLRTLLVRRLYIGERVHVDPRTGEELTTDAKWDGIVNRDVFDAVQRLLSAPERTTRKGGGARHLLSMIARCDVCGGPLSARVQRARREYCCHQSGHVRLDADELDALVVEAVTTYLARPGVERHLSSPTDSAQLDLARAELSTISAELDDLADRVGRGELSAELAARAEPTIRRRLADAEARVDELSTPSRLRDLLPPGEALGRRWAAAPLAARRQILRVLLTDDLLGELFVRRTDGRGAPVAERVRWGT